MDIWETDKLILFIAFVIPGFVSIKVYELLFLSEAKDSGAQLIDAVTYSCINYAILMPVIYFVSTTQLSVDYPFLYSVFWVNILFIAPIFWVWLLWKLRHDDIGKKFFTHPTKKSWDYIFEKKNPYWIFVTLKDGKRIGGLYAYNSHATSGATKEQLFLEQSWIVNTDGFERPKNNTAGILLVNADIESIEFFEVKD